MEQNNFIPSYPHELNGIRTSIIRIAYGLDASLIFQNPLILNVILNGVTNALPEAQ